MEVIVNDDTYYSLGEIPEDEQLVLYKSKLCIRDGYDSLYTVYGEILSGISPLTKVKRIKTITVEI